MASLVVLCSCVLWIGGTTALVVYGFGFPAVVGWIVTMAMSLVVGLLIGFMAHEIRNAVDITDDFEAPEPEPLPVNWWCPIYPLPHAFS